MVLDLRLTLRVILDFYLKLSDNIIFLYDGFVP